MSCSLIRQVLEFCGRFGVEDDVAGAAIATRVLARGVSGDGESLSDAARDALDLVRDPERRIRVCLLYTSPSPRDQRGSRMPSSA